MGNYATKFLLNNESEKENNESQQAATQDSNICTPTLEKKKILVDPRSVSTGITRTPIEVKCTPVGVTKGVINAIPKYLQKKQYLETDMDVVIPPLTPKKRVPKIIRNEQISQPAESKDYNITKNSKVITPIDRERYAVLGLDPRSPAADFDRTPILLPKSLALMRARSQENLFRKGSYETDIYNIRTSCRNDNTLLPKVRSLSDVTSEDVKKNVEEPNELSTSDTSLSDSDSVFKSKEDITVIKNPEYKHEKIQSLLSNEQTIVIDKKEDGNNIDKENNHQDIEYNTMYKNDDEIEIWHDSLPQKKIVSDKENKKIEKLSREDVIITFDEYITDISLLKPVKAEENYLRKGDKEIKNIEVNSKLILNEKKAFTPENKHGTETYKNRTPLGNRSNGQIPKRPPNSPQQLSKNNTKSNKLQQENTLSYKAYSAKARNGIQWDPNSTVFI